MKNRIRVFDIFAIISLFGMIFFLLTDFLDTYPFVALLIIILFVISFFETVISLIKRGVRSNRIKIIAHSIIILTMVILKLYNSNSELFKSNRMLEATLKDDLFYYTLIFRENGTVENQIDGFLGYSKTYKGTYVIKGDTVIFSKKPYDNNFIPDTLLIDRNQGVIFMKRDKNGQFSTKTEWLNHFTIRN